LPGGSEHRVDDLRIARAAADIPYNRLPNQSLIGVSPRPEQACQHHNEAGRAVAALYRARRYHGTPERLRDVVAQSLNGFDRTPSYSLRRIDTRIHRAPIDEDRASATFAFPAAVFGASKVKPIAQRIQQSFEGGDFKRLVAAVNLRSDCRHVSTL
jgi:hypothetical protein